MAFGRGTRLGSYEIIDSLGAGGMGEVYRARDSTIAMAPPVAAWSREKWYAAETEAEPPR